MGATHGGSLIILIISLLRIAFIPLFLLCNAAPHSRNITDVYIPSDTAYLIFMVVFSISNGYIGYCHDVWPQNATKWGGPRSRSLLFGLLFGFRVGCWRGYERIDRPTLMNNLNAVY